jgi:hypothetical protein
MSGYKRVNVLRLCFLPFSGFRKFLEFGGDRSCQGIVAQIQGRNMTKSWKSPDFKRRRPTWILWIVLSVILVVPCFGVQSK